MTSRFWIRAGSATLFLGVTLGAFGAHALKNRLSDPMKAVYQTGVQYQLIHGLALLAVAWLVGRGPSVAVNLAGWSFVTGIISFSGSLYLLSLTGARAWGAVTPLGGLAFLLGWLCLAVHA